MERLLGTLGETPFEIGLAAVSVGCLFVGSVLLFLLLIAGNYLLFDKIGLGRWRAFIFPVIRFSLSRWCMGSTWPFWLFYIGCILIVSGALFGEAMSAIACFASGALLCLIAHLCLCIAIAHSFGCSFLFGLGLAFLPSFFSFVLGVDQTQYWGAYGVFSRPLGVQA